MQRRHFMQFGLAGTALAPTLVLGGGVAAESLRWWRVKHDLAVPMAQAGGWLAVDVDSCCHSGDSRADGLYLYPAWGEPKPYLVRALPGPAAGLAFCDAVTERLLWTDSGEVVFAGRIRGRVPAQVETWLGRSPELPLLEVPALPA